MLIDQDGMGPYSVPDENAPPNPSTLVVGLPACAVPSRWGLRRLGAGRQPSNA